MFGYLVVNVNSFDYVFLKLFNIYLGNGLLSCLFVELREKRGLVYDVFVFYFICFYIFNFIVYIGMVGENIAIVKVGLKLEIECLVIELFSEEELEIFKNKLLG